MKKLTKKFGINKKKFVYLSIEINKNKNMKKVFLVLALVVGLAFTSCKKTNEEMSKVDAPVDSTTTVVVDSVSVDTTAVDTTAAK